MERKIETLEILGTALCLDFANTVNSRREPEHDYLGSYAELAAWAQQVGLLTPAEGRAARALAHTDAAAARKAWQRAQNLRELIFLTFSRLAHGEQPKKENLGKLMDEYAQALAAAELQPQADGYQPAWKQGAQAAALLWPIAHSAGQLLLSDELGKVKECPNCGWLFVDRSKNQSRRWCNMNTCGARDKMRRYLRRRRA
jgi:predicted RNA-binding Zn ribbon-like protein